MRIRLAVPDELDDQDRKAALDAALESVTRTNTGLIRSGKVPPAAKMIKAGRVRWQPEPPGDEHFDLPGTVIGRGHGDCDDLAPWHAASLRASGIDPKARAIVKKSGPRRWHAIVRRGDGSIEDPSRHAGMGSGVNGYGGEVVGSAGSIGKPMSADGRLCLAICPSRDPRHPNIWFARCDVPDQSWDWSSLAASTNPAKAVQRAVKTARSVVGSDIDPDDEARLVAVHHLLSGADPSDVADHLYEILGEDFDLDGCMEDSVHSVGFFGDLVKAIAKPVTSAVQFIKKPSLSNFAAMGLSPFSQQLDLAKAAFKSPLRPLLQAGIPIAATAFGGPLGTAAGGLVSQYLSNATAPRPGGGAPSAAAVPPPPGVAPHEMAQLFQQFMQQQAAPRFMYEAGQTARPWGLRGPTVMRF